jgi:hypothetical protein
LNRRQDDDEADVLRIPTTVEEEAVIHHLERLATMNNRVLHRLARRGVWLLLVLSGCGLDMVAPEGEARLNLTGTVRSSTTGAPIAGATVRLFIITPRFEYVTLASTLSDEKGRYTLTHHLRRVARDPELRGSCTIWHERTSTGVLTEVTAPGHISTMGGIDGGPQLQCTDTPQTLDFRVAPTR